MCLKNLQQGVKISFPFRVDFIYQALMTQNSEVYQSQNLLILKQNLLSGALIVLEENLSYLVVLLLKPFIKEAQSYSHNLAIEAINYNLSNYGSNLQPRFTKGFPLESVEFILKNNTLTLDVENFL